MCPENGAKYWRADNIGLRPGHYIGSSPLCPGSKQGPVDTSQYLIQLYIKPLIAQVGGGRFRLPIVPKKTVLIKIVKLLYNPTR